MRVVEIQLRTSTQQRWFELDNDFADRFEDLREQAQPHFTEN